MRDFTVVWDAARLAWVRERVRAYRMPRLPTGAGWRYGCDPDVLAALCAHWLDGFDEAAAAAELNRFPQILARVEDLDLHAVHVVGEAEGRRPLLLIHGLTDDNVYVQHTLQLADALYMSGKLYEFMPMLGTHMVSDPKIRMRQQVRIMDFLKRELRP